MALRSEFVNIDTRELDDLLKLLNVKAHSKANVNALNRTLIPVRKEGKLAISQIYNIKKPDIKLKITKARMRASQPIAKVKASYRPLNVIKFSATQTSSGVTFQIKKYGGSEFLPGAFISHPQGKDWGKFDQREHLTSPSPLVFGRKGKFGKGFEKYPDRKYKNYPIRPRRGVSLGAMMKNEFVITRMRAVISRDLPKFLIEEVMQGKNGGSFPEDES